MALTNEWETSTFSGSGGSCVEARAIDGRPQVRDSKDREGGVLEPDPDAWRDFLADIKDGRWS